MGWLGLHADIAWQPWRVRGARLCPTRREGSADFSKDGPDNDPANNLKVEVLGRTSFYLESLRSSEVQGNFLLTYDCTFSKGRRKNSCLLVGTRLFGPQAI